MKDYIEDIIDEYFVREKLTTSGVEAVKQALTDTKNETLRGVLEKMDWKKWGLGNTPSNDDILKGYDDLRDHIKKQL